MGEVAGDRPKVELDTTAQQVPTDGSEQDWWPTYQANLSEQAAIFKTVRALADELTILDENLKAYSEELSMVLTMVEFRKDKYDSNRLIQDNKPKWSLSRTSSILAAYRHFREVLTQAAERLATSGQSELANQLHSEVLPVLDDELAAIDKALQEKESAEQAVTD
jgi:hypothetical protein